VIFRQECLFSCLALLDVSMEAPFVSVTSYPEGFDC
jgi:hypothetical protein